METVQGITLGRYRLGALLGRGNRASVYQATLSAGGPLVAIRIFDRDLSEGAEFAQRFRQRAGALETVRHPHLVPIIDHDVYAGQAFLVRPYVAGGTLRRLSKPLPLGEVLALLQPIAAALDHAHEQGFVHGDVKPGNILLPRTREAILADLGIAQLLPRGNSLLMAATGRSYGTPEYLSPEQAHALTLDGRTDQYSLGVILYEALVGRTPFRAEQAEDTPRTIAARHITALPPSPRSLNPSLSIDIERVLLRVLDKDPARRFPSCLAFITALAEADPVASLLMSIPLPEPIAPTRPSTESLFDSAVTALLAVEPPAPSDSEEALLDRLAAQHAAELQALSQSYEAQLTAHVSALRDQEATIGALTRQLVEAGEERERLVAELAAINRERDALQAAAISSQPLSPDTVWQRGGEAVATLQPAAIANADPPHSVGHVSILEPHLYGMPHGKSFLVREEATIGRHPESAILIDEAYTSAHHAQLTREPDGWWLIDLGTKNGTYVNGTRINAPTRLHRGDVLRFGRVRATFS